MKTCSIRKNISSLINFKVTVVFLAVLLPVQTIGADDRLPSYYIYEGQRVKLQPDNTRISVEFVENSSEVRRRNIILNFKMNAMAMEQTVASNIFLVGVGSQLKSLSEANSLVEELISTGDVSFASPVFQGNHDTWVAFSSVILMQFNPEFRANSRDLIKQIAPDLKIIESEFGGMDGALKLQSLSKNGFEVLARANELAEDPRVAWAEPDAHFSGHSSLIPDDPGFVNCWGIRNTGQTGGTSDMDMDGNEAWDNTSGSSSIKVLIIDTGVDDLHADINQQTGADFTTDIGNGEPINACDNHGTPVAGCVSATINNNTGTVGISPGCPSVSARTFISSLACDGSWSSNASWTVDALNWGASQGVRVTNNSSYYGFTSSAIASAYTTAHNSGIVHFSSAGNFNQSFPTYPASLPNVNAVIALEHNGNKASFSNYGIGCNLSAPGVNVYTTDRSGTDGWASTDYTYANGTSFASPYSAGVAALVLSVNPSLTADEVDALLQCTAVDLGAPGWDQTFAAGFVNANDAVNLALNWQDADNDGEPDQCDGCTDTDSDGWGNPGYAANTCTADNCPDNFNPGQEDFDMDGTGDVCCCLGMRGDLNDDGDDCNIVDLTFAVDRIFRFGPATNCPKESDVNSDGTLLNVLDLTFLVDKIFRGGPDCGPCN